MFLLETVKVVREGSRLGYHVINKSAFNQDKHVPFQDGPTPEQRKADREALIARAVELKLAPDAAALAKKGTDVIRAMVDKAEKA